LWSSVERIRGRNRGDLTRMRTEPNPYKRMTPPSTQNLKALGLKVVSFSYMGLAQFSLLEISPVFPLRILPTSGIRAVGLRPGRVQFDPVKVFLMVISDKHVLYKCVNGGTSEGGHE